jgi:hypothetical protein
MNAGKNRIARAENSIRVVPSSWPRSAMAGALHLTGRRHGGTAAIVMIVESRSAIRTSGAPRRAVGEGGSGRSRARSGRRPPGREHRIPAGNVQDLHRAQNQVELPVHGKARRWPAATPPRGLPGSGRRWKAGANADANPPPATRLNSTSVSRCPAKNASSSIPCQRPAKSASSAPARRDCSARTPPSPRPAARAIWR